MGLDGEVHRQHRRLMMPAFHKKRIELYSRTMVALTEETLNNWKMGEGRDIQKEMMSLTRWIATQTLFGQDLLDGGDSIGRSSWCWWTWVWALLLRRRLPVLTAGQLKWIARSA